MDALLQSDYGDVGVSIDGNVAECCGYIGDQTPSVARTSFYVMQKVESNRLVTEAPGIKPTWKESPMTHPVYWDER